VALAQWQTLVTLLSLAANFWFVYRLTHGGVFKIGFNQQRGLEIVRYSTATWAATLGGMLFTKGDRLVVGSLLGSSSLAIYSAMVDFTSAINFFSAQPIQPLLPSVSYLLADPDSANKLKLQKVIRQAVQLNAYVGSSFGSILIIFTPEILTKFLPGAINRSNTLAFQLLTIIVTIYALNASGYFLLYSINRVVESACVQIAAGIISLTLIFLGTTHFNLFGAILGNVGYIVTLLFPILALRYLGFPACLFWSWIWMPLVSFLGIAFISILSLNMKITIFAVSLHIIFCCLDFIHLIQKGKQEAELR
jgi:O-antigen/teichoic acid export membrane protein